MATKIRLSSFGLAGGPARDLAGFRGRLPLLSEISGSGYVRPGAASRLLARVAVAGVAAPAGARRRVAWGEGSQRPYDFLLQLLCDLGFLRISVALCMLVYSCCKGRCNGVPELGNFLRLSDVALDRIRDSRFGSAPTGVLAAQRGCLVMHIPLRPSWGAGIKLLGGLGARGPRVMERRRLCHPLKLPCASRGGLRRTLETLLRWPQ
jgi:hypothetical protein